MRLGLMQTTIGKPVTVSGVGLHTGCPVSITLRPAPVDTGIIFRRVDLEGFEIEALRKNVSRVVMATTLMKRGVMLSTVEHLLSALCGQEIDNLYVEIDSLEVPILDGSALPFVRMLEEAGRVEQNAQRVVVRVIDAIRIQDGDKFISIEPYPGFRISYEIDFVHPCIGNQRLDLEVNPDSYAREIAFARTFGFSNEVEMLLKSGLVRGGTVDNAVVLNEEGVMNPPLRAPDEFVRHKVLDLIGDVSLCGGQILGRIVAYKAGHSLHTRLATELARNPNLSRRVAAADAATAA